jgi:hypothetical protein
VAAAAWTEISSRPTKSGKRRSLARIKFYSLETIAQLSPELRTAANKALYDSLRWSRFLRQAVKVDLLTQRMIHHEDTQAVYS